MYLTHSALINSHCATASQALREGAAKLRKEGYGNKKKEEPTRGPLVVKPILLPNESASGDKSGSYADDAKYRDHFEPPRSRKRYKLESI